MPRTHVSILFPVLFCLLLSPLAAQRVEEKPAADHTRAFAILVDAKTHAAAGDALRAYKAAVEKHEKLATWIVADDWKKPEQVRSEIVRLRGLKPRIEGVALVGRIPVPMLRDAQHLTSAFKMDQERYPRRRSSIPSDRYYEDLDLRFDPLGADEKEPLLHYYSLRADSPQRIQKEIYSGRICFGAKPDVEQLKAYLAKVVRVKQDQRGLKRALVVTGHGYNSGSSNAWAGQGTLLREQMPWLFRPGGRIDFLFHADHRDLKARVLRAMQEPALNLLVFHAHGRPDKQYLLGLPPATTVNAQLEALKRDLRNRLRRAKKRKKDVEAAKAALMKRLEVPESWFAGAFDPEVQKKDDEADAKLDLPATELKDIAPTPEVVIFDECFNGRFIDEGFTAGAYVHQKGGNTVVGIANSVNVLQDIWADEAIGLLAHGIPVGRYHLLRPHLESHLIGDPTFRFAGRGGLLPGPTMNDSPETRSSLVSIASHDEEDFTPLARALALRWLHAHQTLAPDLTLRRFLRDSGDTARLTALRCLAASRCPHLDEALAAGIQDPCEMVRRQTVRQIGDRGNPAHIPALLKAHADDPSRRVAFQSNTALMRFTQAEIAKALETVKLPGDVKASIRTRFVERKRMTTGDLALLADKKAEPKKRYRAIRTFRNYRMSAALEPLLALASDPKEAANLRRTALETLGWFTQSRRRAEIIEGCRKIEAQEGVPAEIRAEAEKTRRRIVEGPNDPFAN